MKFNTDNVQIIKAACEDKKEFEFSVEKGASVFADSDAPESWAAYPPARLSNEQYAEVFVKAGNDKRGELTRLELMVHLDGGRILYKKSGHNEVLVKVTWPNPDRNNY